MNRKLKSVSYAKGEQLQKHDPPTHYCQNEITAESNNLKNSNHSTIIFKKKRKTGSFMQIYCKNNSRNNTEVQSVSEDKHMPDSLICNRLFLASQENQGFSIYEQCRKVCVHSQDQEDQPLTPINSLMKLYSEDEKNQGKRKIQIHSNN